MTSCATWKSILSFLFRMMNWRIAFGCALNVASCFTGRPEPARRLWAALWRIA